MMMMMIIMMILITMIMIMIMIMIIIRVQFITLTTVMPVERTSIMPMAVAFLRIWLNTVVPLT